MVSKQSTPKDAVTKLCDQIRREVELWGHKREYFSVITPQIELTLAEWDRILDRLEMRHV